MKNTTTTPRNTRTTLSPWSLSLVGPLVLWPPSSAPPCHFKHIHIHIYIHKYTWKKVLSLSPTHLCTNAQFTYATNRLDATTNSDHTPNNYSIQIYFIIKNVNGTVQLLVINITMILLGCRFLRMVFCTYYHHTFRNLTIVAPTMATHSFATYRMVQFQCFNVVS